MRASWWEWGNGVDSGALVERGQARPMDADQRVLNDNVAKCAGVGLGRNGPRGNIPGGPLLYCRISIAGAGLEPATPAL